MLRLAIIGASYLQMPLINKAKEMGYETHVFAWECGDVGESAADVFHPISIVEKERILEECRKLDVAGICSIASDLAMLTVNYVATEMGLISNAWSDTCFSTNKIDMIRRFKEFGVPAPDFVVVSGVDEVDTKNLTYPLIVKPSDRSGSRGITRLNDPDQDLKEAIDKAIDQSFEKRALIEQYIGGHEYSVECISYEGQHTMLSVTRKFTTGDPHYIETGHLEPAPLEESVVDDIRKYVFSALDSLNIRFGASHSELKIDGGKIYFIEIGGRMGGDRIGSDLVFLSTGYDFVKAVIDVAVGNKPDTFNPPDRKHYAAIRYLFNDDDLKVYQTLQKTHPDLIYSGEISEERGDITDSSTRWGHFIMRTEDMSVIEGYLPSDKI